MSTQRIILQLSDSPNVVKNCFFQQTEHWQTEESPSCLWWKDAKCPVPVLLLWTTSCSMRKSKTRILHSQLLTLKWRKQSLFRVLKCPTTFFHLAFLMHFFSWFLAEVLPRSPYQSKEWLSSPFQKERGFPQRKKFPCSHNTTNSLFSTHVQALTWGRKKPLNWCCNLIPSFIFSKFHLTAHIFSLAYFFSQALTSVLYSASLFSILLCWTLRPCISSPGCYNIARQLTDYQTQHARKQFLLFLRKIA